MVLPAFRDPNVKSNGQLGAPGCLEKGLTQIAARALMQINADRAATQDTLVKAPAAQ
jgi:hypothetical protein